MLRCASFAILLLFNLYHKTATVALATKKAYCSPSVYMSNKH